MKKGSYYRILQTIRQHGFYYDKEDFYRSFIDQYCMEEALTLLTKDNGSVHKTDMIIAPYDIQFGIKLEELIPKVGRPDFHQKDINDLNDHRILFYKTILLRQRVLTQFHFLKGFFYYAQITFLSYNDKTNAALLNSVKDKYQCPVSFEASDIVCLTDGVDNKLIVEKGIYLTVSYICGDPFPSKVIEEQIRLKKDLVIRSDNYEIERLSKLI
jgi:hypothetical protein